MSPATVRSLRVLFYAYVAVTFLHIAYVVHHEPFSFDAWNVSLDTHAKPASIGRFFEFWHQQYTTSNPRLGQPFAYLAYKIDWLAEIMTPLAFFAIVLGGFVLGTGRWPSRKNHRDLATLAIGIGFMWFAAPNMPAYMFCRAYATNYIWAIAIQLWFLVPLRLHGATASGTSIPKLIAYFVFGVAAGMCNEHTGPTLVAFTVGYALWQWRKHGRRSALVWCGVAGAIVGFAIIFFAPGQSQRYEGVAEHYSAVQQVLVRGISGNIDIYLDYLQAAAPLMLVALAGMVVGLLAERRADGDLGEVRTAQRNALAFFGIALLAGSTITMTVFASPKLGPRFYMHASLFLLAALLGVLPAFLHRARSYVPFVLVAVIASGYAIARTVPGYTRTKRESDRRLAELVASSPGGVYTAEAWDPITETWWTLGDDFRDQKKQEMVADYFGLARVLFRGGDPWKPLGLTDIKLTMKYDIDPPQCLDMNEELAIKPWIGREVGAIHHAFLDAISEIQRVTKAHLKSVDLVATFLGTQPPLPRKTMYVGRWAEGNLEAYTAQIKRSGRSSTREVVVSPALKQSEWEMFVVAIGEPPKRIGVSNGTAKLTYEPWTSGVYWVTACKPDYCFVVSSTTHVVVL